MKLKVSRCRYATLGLKGLRESFWEHFSVNVDEACLKICEDSYNHQVCKKNPQYLQDYVNKLNVTGTKYLHEREFL